MRKKLVNFIGPACCAEFIRKYAFSSTSDYPFNCYFPWFLDAWQLFQYDALPSRRHASSPAYADFWFPLCSPPPPGICFGFFPSRIVIREFNALKIAEQRWSNYDSPILNIIYRYTTSLKFSLSSSKASNRSRTSSSNRSLQIFFFRLLRSRKMVSVYASLRSELLWLLTFIEKRIVDKIKISMLFRFERKILDAQITPIARRSVRYAASCT